MSTKYYIMVTTHRMLVGEADSHKEINEIYDRLNEYEGYKGKMKILQEFGSDDDSDSNSKPYPFPDYDSNIDEEETRP